MHAAESLSVITRGLFCRCRYTDTWRCTEGNSEREPMAAFTQICQEGRIMRTLIGMIHSHAEHNKQLCFPSLSEAAAATVHSCFSLPVRFRRLSRGYEDVPVVPSHGPAKLGPLVLGRMPPHKPLPEELCRAPLSLVCRQGTCGIIHSI